MIPIKRCIRQYVGAVRKKLKKIVKYKEFLNMILFDFQVKKKGIKRTTWNIKLYCRENITSNMTINSKLPKRNGNWKKRQLLITTYLFLLLSMFLSIPFKINILSPVPPEVVLFLRMTVAYSLLRVIPSLFDWWLRCSLFFLNIWEKNVINMLTMLFC